MAWQSPSAMNNGAGGGPEANGPPGTEYTLQGELPLLPLLSYHLRPLTSHSQVSCAFFNSNGIDTRGNGMPGTLSGRK